MDVTQLQERINAIPWYHEFDFPHGLTCQSRTPDVDWHRRNWRFIEDHLASIDFSGKSVLDVGCWDGYWSFYAERRGASRVLATDDFSQNWSSAEGLRLARELLDSSVEINTELSVYRLASLGQTFDIILFLGVYYHLLDPLYALAQLRHCCHPGTLVVIEGNEGVALPPHSAVFDMDHATCKFLPTAGYLRQILRASYFSVTSEHAMEIPTKARHVGWRWRLQMCWQALRGSRTGVQELIPGICAIRRLFLTCVPINGINSAHTYCPPFGLHVYDSRFNK